MGAGSVVTKDVPENTIYAGNPANKIRDIKLIEKKFDDKYYNQKYFDARRYPDLDIYLKKVIKALIPETKKMSEIKALDVACGVGIYCKYLIWLGVKSVTGIDFSKNALKQARMHVPKAKFTYGDSKNLPFKDNQFDLILNAHMIEHFTDDDIIRFMKEAFRVLKKDGKLLIITPNGWCPNRFLFPKTWFYDPSHINFLSPLKIRSMLLNAGFTSASIKQKLSEIEGAEIYIPQKGYYGISKIEKLFPGTFETLLKLANNFPFMLFRDVAYLTATK